MEPKIPSQSRTIMLAILTIVVGVGGALPEIYKIIQDNPLNFEDVTQLIVGLLTIVIGVAAAILRTITTSPIVWKK